MLLLGAQAECEKLKSQIVRSPEKIKKVPLAPIDCIAVAIL